MRRTIRKETVIYSGPYQLQNIVELGAKCIAHVSYLGKEIRINLFEVRRGGGEGGCWKLTILMTLYLLTMAFNLNWTRYFIFFYFSLRFLCLSTVYDAIFPLCRFTFVEDREQTNLAHFTLISVYQTSSKLCVCVCCKCMYIFFSCFF